MINTITLGDSYKLIKDIPDKSIDLVVIDPPYKFDGGGTGGAFGSDKRNYHKEYLELYKKTGKTEETERLRICANADRQRENIKFVSEGFDNSILDELCRVMKKINIYIWCSKGQLRQIIDYFDDLGCFIDLLTWHKTNPTPMCNNTYLSDTEYCFFIREKGVKIYGSYATKRKYYVTPANVADKKLYKHPTIKPIDIIKNIIVNSSNENDIVLDCFSGSGTTCVAAKGLNRRFIGIELDEEYHKISLERLNPKEEFEQITF